MSGRDFGEHLANLAADGEDVSAPVPYKRRIKGETRPDEEEHEENADE